MSSEPLPRQVIALARLSQLEWEIRLAEDDEALEFIAANDSHRLVEYDHALVYRERLGRITAVSGAIRIDDTAPQIKWFNQLAGELTSRQTAAEVQAIGPEFLSRRLKKDYATWITGNALWVPHLGPQGKRYGATIVLRRSEFSEAEMRILARLGGAFGQAGAALSASAGYGAGNRRWRRRVGRATRWIGGIAALLMLLHLPMPLTVLAEARVVPIDPILVSSPLNGVVNSVLVQPNEYVRAGQQVLELDATELRSEREIAEKRVMVLNADHIRMEQKAFSDPAALAEVGLARSRLAEGRTELAIADARLSRIIVASPRSGIAVFDDPNAWMGRPVRIGERVMSIADPAQVKLEIHIGVDDMLVVEPDAEVEFFLATAPENALSAQLKRVSYDVRVLPSQTVAFIADAHFAAATDLPRLGMTGTAKIIGRRAPLYFLLFRKPLSAFRRLSGF